MAREIELSISIESFYIPLILFQDVMSSKRPRSSRGRRKGHGPRGPQIQWPASSKDILKLFTLSRTNQILRGRSPIFEVRTLSGQVSLPAPSV